MGDWEYGRENGLWGDDGIPYGVEPIYRYKRKNKTFKKSEVEKYVAFMNEFGFSRIVSMNNYITKHELWEMFSSIKQKHTSASGLTSMGVSKDAYREIINLYRTDLQESSVNKEVPFLWSQE